MTQSLEERAAQIKTRIAKLHLQLDKVNDAIHAKYLKESGLLGKVAISDRVPGGIIVADITFKTWAPREPQSVSGRRLQAEHWTTIPLTSTGFQIHDAHPTSHGA